MSALKELVPLMKELETDIRKHIMRNTDHTHDDVFYIMAEKHELYDDTDAVPIWLSRVIAGIARDLDEEMGRAYPDQDEYGYEEGDE
jgi:hypothetical protein